MSIYNFIPSIWSARLVEFLQKSLVFAQPGVINRNYEGEIADKGDTVRLTGIGAVTISDYVRNTDMSAAEALVDAATVLLIDQQKYFNFQVDDCDRTQSNPAMIDQAMRNAAYGIKDAMDTLIAGLYTDCNATSHIGSGGNKTFSAASDAYGYLVDLGVVLTDAKCPTDGRWVVIPPWFLGLLQKDDRFVKSGAESGAVALANGKVGEAAGFSVHVSQNVNSSSTTFHIMAGTDMAITFAETVNKVEGYRPPLRFADAVKGLALYGAKVVQPDCLAVLTCTKPTSLVA